MLGFGVRASLACLLLEGLGLEVAGCGEACSTAACQSITVATQAPLAGSVLDVQGAARPLTSACDMTIPDGTCCVALEGGNLGNPDPQPSPGGPPPAFRQAIKITCTLGQDQLYWGIDIGDVRDAAVGVRPLVPGMPTGTINGPVGQPGNTTLCTLTGDVTLTIDSTVGGSLPFPVLVTPDYSKRMHLTIGSVSATPSETTGMSKAQVQQVCDTLTGLTATLDFATAAADIQGESNGNCRVCEG
jgi:hypothetical protein